MKVCLLARDICHFIDRCHGYSLTTTGSGSHTDIQYGVTNRRTVEVFKNSPQEVLTDITMMSVDLSPKITSSSAEQGTS